MDTPPKLILYSELLHLDLGIKQFGRHDTRQHLLPRIYSSISMWHDPINNRWAVAVAELAWKLRVGRQFFFATQHINCQFTVKIQNITFYFLSILGLCRLMAIKQLIISSYFTFKKISRSIKVTKQSSKRSSFILFLNLFLIKCMVENALSNLAVATGRINTNLRSKYTKS
jgi:hypothetical protein